MAEGLGPAPHGAGGLKFCCISPVWADTTSRPARGGWIEILVVACINPAWASRPARGGWIEMAFYGL